MHYRIRDNLSFCVTNGQAIFLDIDADRYFRLPDRLERPFVSYLSAKVSSDTPALAELSKLNILVASTGNDELTAPPDITKPERSAMEMVDRNFGTAIPLIPEVMASVWNCRRRLRTRGLKEMIDRTRQQRRGQRILPRPVVDRWAEERLLGLCSRFHRARMHVPTRTCCLPDSLVLAAFLTRRGIHTNVVFGVTCDPFAAHCWVQTGDMVLNDTVGSAMAHTPILVL